MKKLGVIVNPVAGIGGRVGLKGSDGVEILRQARELGARSESTQRTIHALKLLEELQDRIQVITYPGGMGEDACRQAGLSPIVIGAIEDDQSTPEDTVCAARDMLDRKVDLTLFAGGDGTARDVCRAVGESLPVLGIPAGVKIHSAVYAVTPRGAGEVASMFLEGRLMAIREAEVMDIDEDAFRAGIITAKLYGYLRVPEESRFLQSVKAGSVLSEKEALQGMASDVVDKMTDSDCYFIIGPGTTTRSIMETLGLDNTLLGVDVVRKGEVVANDVSEQQLLELIQGKTTKIILTVIGGQGHLFGRGNQQLSPRVIREVGRKSLIVIATKEKLTALTGRPLLVDTGDEDLNEELSGYIRVTTGYADYVMYPVGV